MPPIRAPARSTMAFELALFQGSCRWPCSWPIHCIGSAPGQGLSQGPLQGSREGPLEPRQRLPFWQVDVRTPGHDGEARGPKSGAQAQPVIKPTCPGKVAAAREGAGARLVLTVAAWSSVRPRALPLRTFNESTDTCLYVPGYKHHM